MSPRKDCTESTSPHFRRISHAAFKVAWLDRSRLLPELTKEFGLSGRALRERAKSMGLPVRAPLGREVAIKKKDEALFVYLYKSGVAINEIAAHFGISNRAVGNNRARLGLAPRDLGFMPTTTISDLIQIELARHMAAASKVEQAAMIAAEMVDKRRDNRLVGAEHARGVM